MEHHKLFFKPRQKKLDLIERLNYIKDFFESEYFSNIPYVNISSGLWALLKRDVKRKKYLTSNNEANIKDKIKGIPFDIEHLSVFAPYCDAVLTEDRMAKWLKEWSNHALGGYNFNIFSIKEPYNFNLYLDTLENNMSLEMKEELNIVEE